MIVKTFKHSGTKLLLLKEHLKIELNINYDTVLFPAPFSDAILLSFSSFLFIIVHATNSIKFKFKQDGKTLQERK